ncbi:hypothetical protein BJ912DRAFT_475407 [Pholiota molesta]|nr:hypothetical protein BJ912DRAFT_475407 [Pholiota molesta]
MVLPVYWPTLTRIARNEVDLSPDIWFFFIRAVPNLQQAHIDADHLIRIDSNDHTTPPTYTHPWEKPEFRRRVELGLLIEAGFFCNNGWLDLKYPAYPAPKFTLIVKTWASRASHGNAELGLMVSNIRERADIAPKVVVQIALESEGESREEERGRWYSRIEDWN